MVDIVRIYHRSYLKEAALVRFTYKTDAAFTKPAVYECLEARGLLCRSYGVCDPLRMTALW